MSISDRRDRGTHPSVRLVLEALGLAALFACLPEFARGLGVVGFEAQPHPGWLAVLALAAWNGGRGLFAGLAAAATGIGIGSVAAAADPLAAYRRLESAADLVAFGACLLVSGIASLHLRQRAALERRLGSSVERAARAEATMGAMREAVWTMRARLDRASTSLSFLRDVAGRLDGTDPVAAAEGAADLALARTGASAAAVEVGVNGFRRRLAVRDARGPRVSGPLALPEADLTVPIRQGRTRVGALELWGVTLGELDEPTAHDLAVIASWCATPLACAGTGEAEAGEPGPEAPREPLSIGHGTNGPFAAQAHGHERGSR